MANDNGLIYRVQAGDEEAFSELMRAYYAYVYAIVIGIVSNPHDAEEIVQDTFLSAYRGLALLEDTAKFKSWLAEIARNRARDRLRKQRVDTVSIDEVGEHTLQAPDAIDEQLIRDEQLELIRRAMETLSEKDREIARSYYLDGASYDELIQTHGLSYKAISFRLSRAKQRLTKRLQHLLSGLSVPSTTILKQIYSGGLIVMKIGTVPKIAVTGIGIVALIFIGFIGSREFLSSNDKPSPSVEVVAPTADTTAQTDATRRDNPTTPSPETQWQISKKDNLDSEGHLPEGRSPETASDTVHEEPVDSEKVSGDTDKDSEKEALIEAEEYLISQIVSWLSEADRLISRLEDINKSIDATRTPEGNLTVDSIPLMELKRGYEEEAHAILTLLWDEEIRILSVIYQERPAETFMTL